MSAPAELEPRWKHDGSKATEQEVLDLINGLVGSLKPKVCVETGTFTGMGTLAIQRALVDSDYGHLTTIESSLELFNSYQQGAIERVDFVHGDSLEFAMEWAATGVEIDFAFVDCGDWPHRVEVCGALRDSVNGLLLLHDTVYYPELMVSATAELGALPSLHIPSLHGLTIWELG